MLHGLNPMSFPIHPSPLTPLGGSILFIHMFHSHTKRGANTGRRFASCTAYSNNGSRSPRTTGPRTRPQGPRAASATASVEWIFYVPVETQVQYYTVEGWSDRNRVHGGGRGPISESHGGIAHQCRGRSVVRTFQYAENFAWRQNRLQNATRSGSIRRRSP